MSPITDAQTEPSTARLDPSSSKQDTSSSQASDETLGYEVLYGRRVNGIQVPLSLSQSLSKPQAPKRSTGSALLDSFVGDRPTESTPLRNLRLVNVAKRRPQSTATANKPRHKSAAQEKAPQKSAAQGAAPQKLAAKGTAPQTKEKSLHPPTTPALKSTPPKTKAPDQPVGARHMPSATMRLPDIPPPPEAEPEVLPEVTEKATKEVIETAAPRQRVIPPVPTPQRPPITPSQIQSAPAFSRQPSTGEKESRDSAASVGLIDLDDTLLFGGESQDLGNSDPFVTATESSGPGVLAYITLQVSAFTVTKLKSAFPYNTDPKVLNRSDPPKRSTVLDLQHFELGRLTNLDKEPPPLKQTQPPQQIANAEVSVLSQQVKMLNQKIADLSEKLAQVADNKADG